MITGPVGLWSRPVEVGVPWVREGRLTSWWLTQRVSPRMEASVEFTKEVP